MECAEVVLAPDCFSRRPEPEARSSSYPAVSSSSSESCIEVPGDRTRRRESFDSGLQKVDPGLDEETVLGVVLLVIETSRPLFFGVSRRNTFWPGPPTPPLPTKGLAY
jgi:hypothetical protein